MYSGRQSDQGVGANLMATVCPSANISKEYLETNWNNVTMDQKIGSNGPYGFPSYSLELDEKQGLYNPSTGAVCPDFQTNNEHSGNTSAKEKKRKGKAECDAMQNPSPRNRVQMEAQSKSMGNSVEKDEKKISPKMQSKEDSSDGDDPKGEYVHVRAKRGQATNSHSLAERMRRKKISERMKLLQDLVPGCSKITGKAVMLDEIINYVQSLQRQVEFLSMKLAAVNPELSFDLEQILSKEILLSQDRHLAFYGTDQGSSSLLGQFNQGSMQSEMLCSVSNPADTLPTTIHDISPMSQMPAMWDGLQNVAHMEFAPGMAADSTNNAESMKMEQ